MLSRPILSESSDIMHAISDSDAWAVMDVTIPKEEYLIQYMRFGPETVTDN